MARILIVEDEERIASFVAKGLAADGHRTTARRRRARGARPRPQRRVRPDGARHRAARHGRLRGARPAPLPGLASCPVIVLTARDSVTDTVSALEGGADDYMPKPFRFAELLARIRLRLRTAPDGGPAPRRRPGGRRRTPRRPHPPRHRRRARARALRPRVLPRRDPDGQRRPGALPRTAARPGLGLRLRPRLERRRRLRRLPAQEVRRHHHRHRARAWATASTTELLDMVGCGNPRAECLALTRVRQAPEASLRPCGRLTARRVSRRAGYRVAAGGLAAVSRGG